MNDLDDVDETHVDGNAVAGALQELFAVEITTVTAVCAGCGHAAVLAEARVYLNAPGTVVRCRGCGEVVLRLVTAPHATWLDLSGVTRLTVRSAPS